MRATIYHFLVIGQHDNISPKSAAERELSASAQVNAAVVAAHSSIVFCPAIPLAGLSLFRVYASPLAGLHYCLLADLVRRNLGA